GPVGLEFFRAPRLLAGDVLAGRAAGDCDDLSMLGATLLEALGHPARFVVGGEKDGRDVDWRHVWVEALGPRGWTAIDDTMKRRRPGWDPAPRFGVVGKGRPRYRAGMGVSFGLGHMAPTGLGNLGRFKVGKVLKKVAAPVVRIAAATVSPAALLAKGGPSKIIKSALVPLPIALLPKAVQQKASPLVRIVGDTA